MTAETGLPSLVGSLGRADRTRTRRRRRADPDGRPGRRVRGDARRARRAGCAQIPDRHRRPVRRRPRDLAPVGPARCSSCSKRRDARSPSPTGRSAGDLRSSGSSSSTRSTAPYALFLDDDVWLEPGALERMHSAIVELGCGFVGEAVQGLSYVDDDRPVGARGVRSSGTAPSLPERVRPGTPAYERWRLHNAANLVHLAAGLDLEPGEWRAYHVAWIGGCTMYDRAALIDAGGFDFWSRLPSTTPARTSRRSGGSWSAAAERASSRAAPCTWKRRRPFPTEGSMRPRSCSTDTTSEGKENR